MLDVCLPKVRKGHDENRHLFVFIKDSEKHNWRIQWFMTLYLKQSARSGFARGYYPNTQ